MVANASTIEHYPLPAVIASIMEDYRRFIAGPTLNNSRKEVDFF